MWTAEWWDRKRNMTKKKKGGKTKDENKKSVKINYLMNIYKKMKSNIKGCGFICNDES